MSSDVPTYHSKISPEIWTAAKTRLPLRLPNPAETGLHRHATDPQSRERCRCKPARNNRPVEVRRQVAEVSVPLSDAELEAMAQQSLLQSGVRGFTKLHVEVRESVATLYGRLPTDIERQVVTQLVRRVNGIARVEQEIVVDEFTCLARPPAVRPDGKRWNWWVALSLVGVLAAVLISVLAN